MGTPSQRYGRHLPCGITQCYLPPDTSECAPPNPSHTVVFRVVFWVLYFVCYHILFRISAWWHWLFSWNKTSFYAVFRYRVREELRRLGDSRRHPSVHSRNHRHLHELDSAQEDQLHSAVNQAIHGPTSISQYFCLTSLVIQSYW